MMQITVIGSQGQLGQDLMLSLAAEEHQLTGLTHQQISIEDVASIETALEANAPDLIINTAAYNKVDQAETSPEAAFAINAFGPRNLAQYCQKKKIRLMHISTDYVFGLDSERQTAYTELDAPGPLSAYGQSKLAGEYFVRAICPQHYVVRTCGLYGKAGKTGNGNFVETMLRLGKERDELSIINDQHCTPTSTRDLSTSITHLIQSDEFGLYHATNQGQMTWFEFAQSIFEITGINVKMTAISTEQFNAAADRPRFSVLDCSRLQKASGFSFPHWKSALKTYLEQ
ncbi:MAG: dTDP-4-dehydrorhamnose reductase [Planctomycetes bacterium]|nr:dTDP-4-dehydrorhamnose reductase [Planctomycetota bacterium]MCH9727403.1 dTDP-4-dehydrorhamnose reductase [Planctomycetota bacterium]MCH9775908.1 dTDP-4-dehydrorhamnose reductase [Planctomycetota bacterium]MCH9792587.1 dTDP-4-dehydrorhamnose reductase [Planctomycetota bacterium]